MPDLAADLIDGDDVLANGRVVLGPSPNDLQFLIPEQHSFTISAVNPNDDDLSEEVDLIIDTGFVLAPVNATNPPLPPNVIAIQESFVVGNIAELLAVLRQFQAIPGPAGTVVPITTAQLAALAAQGQLTGVVYQITDAPLGGGLAIASSPSTYRTYYGAHVGNTPPSDTSVIWFDTSHLV